MKKTTLTFLFGFAIFISGVPAHAGKLSGSQLQAHFAGKTFIGSWKGNPLQLKAYRNGNLAGVSKGRFDQGRWFIKDQYLCFSLKVWTKNKPKCGNMYKSGSKYFGFIRSNGKPRLVLKRK